MSRSTTLLLCITAFLSSTEASAQVPTEVRRSQTSGVDFYTTNYGIFGLNVGSGNAGFIYPRGAGGVAYIFGGGMWFAAQKSVDGSLRELVEVTYDPNSGVSWMKPGEWTTDPTPSGPSADQLAYSREHDAGTGAYTGSGNRPAWPLWQMGNTLPSFSDPGIYIADSALRTPARSGTPAFVGGVAEQFVSRYHDGDTSRFMGEGDTPGLPLGLQIEQNVYGFSAADLDATVILHYRVINVSSDTLRACYISSMLDPDIGANAGNDAAGYYNERPELSTAYAWSASEPGSPGTLTITLLESPAVETNSLDPSFGFVRHDKRHYDPSEQVGLATVQNWTIAEDPNTPSERYDFMASGDLDVNDSPGDRRVLLSSGPFNLAPGDTARLAVGLTVLRNHRITSTGAQLPVEQAAERMIALYQTIPVSSVDDRTAPGGAMSIASVHPNPATGTTSVAVHLPRRTDVTIQLVDALGRVVLSRETMMEAGDRMLNLDLGGVAPGVYIISVEADGERQSRRVVVAH